MARSGGPRRTAGSGRRAAGARPGPSASRSSRPARDETPGTDTPRTFRLGAVPGATPGKWIAAWRERYPHVELELVPLDADAAGTTLTEGAVDAAIVRLPLDDEETLHVIRLYDEVPVAVVPSESHLTVADELTLADLSGEVIVTPRDDVLGADVPGAVAPAFDAPQTTADAIATVGAGVGVVLVPMSLARLHARRDVAVRTLRDGPASTVALAWRRDADTVDTQAFAGIARGRTANSSR